MNEEVSVLNKMVVMVVFVPIAYELIEMLFGRGALLVIIAATSLISAFVLIRYRYFDK